MEVPNTNKSWQTKVSAECTGKGQTEQSEGAGAAPLQGSAAGGHAGPPNSAEAFVVHNSQAGKAEFSANEIPDRLHFQGYHDACPLLPPAVVACPLVL